LGWEGSDSQWRHCRRAYGWLAAFATPLVLSVHSVVSWDFAMALVPGWHSTLFAPFFVDGAIFSGFAMVLVLILPMRYFFDLRAYVTDRHLDMMAKLILVTGLVLTYFYVCELFTSWYSGEHIEKASLFWRLTSTYWWALFTMYFCNCVSPLIRGSVAWFFLLFLGFIKVMPSLSVVDVKETLPPPMKEAAHGGHH